MMMMMMCFVIRFYILLYWFEYDNFEEKSVVLPVDHVLVLLATI